MIVIITGFQSRLVVSPYYPLDDLDDLSEGFKGTAGLLLTMKNCLVCMGRSLTGFSASCICIPLCASSMS